MNSLAFEMKQAARTIGRSPSTSALAVAILALTIAFSTAVFSVADGVLFKPLPYPSPDRLVELRLTTPRIANGIPLTGRELDSARAASGLIEQAEAFNISGVVSRIDGPEPERLRAGRVTPGLLPMLGARMIGQGFSAEHTAGQGADVTVLTYDYWATRMGADPSVVGTLLRIDGEPPLRILGVIDAAFVFPWHSRSASPQILRPLPDAWLEDDGRAARTIARLAPGVSAEAAASAVPVDGPAGLRKVAKIVAMPLHERLAYSARDGLVMLFLGVLALLFIGMLDVAGLLLVRATSREREIATRRALGATSAQIGRQLLFEALMVAAAGGALGLVVAQTTFGSLLHLVPEQFRFLQPTGVDTRAMLFAAGAAVITAILFGLTPLVHLRRVSGVALRAGHGQTQGRSIRRISSAVVAGQIATTVALLILCTLLVSSFVRLRNAPTGFDAEQLAYISVTPPPSMLPERGDFYRNALERLGSIQGVESVALLNVPALRNTIRNTSFAPAGRPQPESSGLFSESELVVSPGYFHTAGLRLIDGRPFSEDDERPSSSVAIVNETLARTWFPGERAVGQQLVDGKDRRTIVGVVEDARHFSLKEEPIAEIFLPPDPASPIYGGTFVIRAEDPQRAITPAVAAIRALAPTLPITSAETGETAISRSAEAERFYAELLAICAAAGVTLAIVGLYGMLSWSVGSRRRELGVRSALGAGRRNLAWSIAREAVPIIAVGGSLGALLGWWGARLAVSLLYEVTPTDLTAWTAALAIALVSSAIAIAIPCRRAFLTNPVEALRLEG